MIFENFDGLQIINCEILNMGHANMYVSIMSKVKYVGISKAGKDQ